MVALLCMLCTSIAGHDQAALDFLASLQTDKGAFVSAPWSDGELSKATLRTTRTAIRVHRLLGVKVPNRGKVIEFLLACYDQESGGFATQPGLAADPISTSVALMIMNELELPIDTYRDRALEFMNSHTEGFEQIRMVAPGLEDIKATVPNAPKWIAEIEKTRGQDGSYGIGPGQARSTALSVVALMRLGATIDATKTLQVLRAGQRSDGGFGSDSPGGSDLESCYRIVRVFHRLKQLPENVRGLHEFINSCRNADGGYGRTPSEPSSLHGTYYATIVRDWLMSLQYVPAKQYNFDEANQSGVPTDWYATRALLEPGSQWKLQAALGAQDNQVLTQTAINGPKKQFNVCVAPDIVRDVDLSVSLHSLTGKIDRGGGLVWRYQDVNSYYVMRWNPLENNVRLYKVVDGVRSQLDSAAAPGDPEAWHALRVVTVGRNIRGYFNDQLLIDAEDDQFPNAGRVGLWTKADAATEFDNLKLQSAFIEMIDQ